MSDYRCPNCSGYTKCDDHCPTGGLRAEGQLDVYRRTRTSLEEYWMNHRLYETPITLDGLLAVVDTAWRNSLQAKGRDD